MCLENVTKRNIHHSKVEHFGTSPAGKKFAPIGGDRESTNSFCMLHSNFRIFDLSLCDLFFPKIPDLC